MNFLQYKTFDDITEWSYPFGRSTYPNIYLHRRPGKIVAVYESKAVAELHEDNSIYLLFNAENVSTGVYSRWAYFMGNGNVEFETRLLRRANGLMLRSVKAYVKTYNSKRSAYDGYTVGPVVAQSRIKVSQVDGKLVFEPADSVTKTATKDNTTYRAFNAKLKKLRGVLAAQAKMGVYDTTSQVHRRHFSQQIAQITGSDEGLYVPWHKVREKLYDLALQFTETNDVALADPIAKCCMYLHESTTGTNTEQLLSRFRSGLAGVQKRYLRDNCVKIEESKNSLSQCDVNNQDSELQSSPGLREVQIPGEAEVC